MKKILAIGVFLLLCAISGFGQSKGTWEKTQSQKTITAYEEFLKKYPESKYKELAQKQLADLQKQKEIQDSIKQVKIKEALLVSDKIIPGISIQEVLSLLSLKNLESIIFPTGAKTFTGTAKISGFELVLNNGIVVSKKVNQEDLGSGGFETHTTLVNSVLK
ncbi:MAG TPA: hypothetical protein VIK55_03900 [Paludibacter sp.]